MTNWDAFRLLCRSLAGDASALACALAADNVHQVLSQAAQRDLLHTLGVRVTEHPAPGERWSAAALAPLRAALEDNTRRQMQLRAQAVKLARALNAAGLEPVFLKGTALMWAEPAPHAGFRRQLDIDLLMPPEQLAPAARALLADGYLFCDYARPQPELFDDPQRAARLAAHHHHLPPMLKPGQGATLELHRHPLPRRFQSRLPLQAFLAGSRREQRHDAVFHLPHPALQRLALACGAFVHDGYAARCDFPVRAGLDYLALLQQEAAFGAVAREPAAREQQVFEQLVAELMGLEDGQRRCAPCDVGARLQLLRWRLQSPSVASTLDLQARARHLGVALWYNSAKLPGYLQRRAATLLPQP